MPSTEQRRAARGLLGWTQQKLADEAGMSKTAINNFERGTHDARGDSNQAIHDAFERSGIEFIGDYGIQRRRDTVKILKDEDALPRLWDDIFDTLRDTGGEVLIANLDEAQSQKIAPQKLADHLARLKAHGISERLLVREGDRNFLQPVHYYRWLPHDVFEAGMTTFVYGDKIALQLWQDTMIVLINGQAAYQAERQRFEYLWQGARIPDPS